MHAPSSRGGCVRGVPFVRTSKLNHQEPTLARYKFHRGIAVVCLSCTLGSLGVVFFGHPSQAAPKPAKPAAEAEPAEAEDDAAPAGASRSVKLNYIQASWSKVLKDFGTATGLTIVADRAPMTKFTRLDRSLHSPAEALKILNRELESQGFRL